MFCREVVRQALSLEPGWEPMGAVAVGHAAAPAPPRPPRPVGDFIVER
jgi:coenzyme F420-0:L-glutamate ligase/coenzyme F420-1:gamma-L-glutamate ligase